MPPQILQLIMLPFGIFSIFIFLIVVFTFVNDRFCELPPDSDIDLTNVEFPVSVELNWSPTGDCGRYILIESIALIE